jgi:transformation/transcription domain-associated protein
VKYGVSNSRSHVARVLYLLSFDTPNEPVGRALDKYLEQLPNWVWLSWIPQLLLSLQRNEAPHCKLILMKVAQVYPQVPFKYFCTIKYFCLFLIVYKTSAIASVILCYMA